MQNNVREARARKGWSIKQLHEVAGVSYGHISDIETGKSVPTIVTARKLARALDTTVEELFPDLAETDAPEPVGSRSH